MPKGYLVANIRVNDTEVFKKFSQTALPLIERHCQNKAPFLTAC